MTTIKYTAGTPLNTHNSFNLAMKVFYLSRVLFWAERCDEKHFAKNELLIDFRRANHANGRKLSMFFTFNSLHCWFDLDGFAINSCRFRVEQRTNFKHFLRFIGVWAENLLKWNEYAKYILDVALPVSSVLQTACDSRV